MTADFVVMCDAIKTDLVANVTGLGSAKVPTKNRHLYEPWDPENLEADGARHLAVWPLQEAEEKQPLATGSHALNQQYAVVVWESSGTESTRLQRDEAGAATFLQLHNDTRGRFYVETNQQLGGSDRVWYVGTSFPVVPGPVRWFAITVEVRRFAAFV